MAIFDSEAQFFGFLKKARTEKLGGAEAVGLFGSRARGDHTPEKSDVDMMVEKKVSQWGEYVPHDENNIQVVRAPDEITGNDPNSEALKNMRGETRWIWREKKRA